MATAPKGVDRRVQKTRQVIRQAFVEIVREKGLVGATVQEVTERANISRGTFYAHYADKYELADVIVREEFQKAIKTALPVNAGWNRKTLQILVQTLLENFKGIYQRHQHSREIAPILEQALHEELSKVILALFKQNVKQKSTMHLSLETTAQVISWTIFGAAVAWSQKGVTISAQQMAEDIVVMIMDGVTKLGIQYADK